MNIFLICELTMSFFISQSIMPQIPYMFSFFEISSNLYTLYPSIFLPDIPEELYLTDTVIKVRDSKLGWAKAYRELVSLLCTGLIPSWDMTKVRPAGSVLKTFGGRASGPEPLEALFKFTIEK